MVLQTGVNAIQKHESDVLVSEMAIDTNTIETKKDEMKRALDRISTANSQYTKIYGKISEAAYQEHEVITQTMNMMR